MGRVLQPFDYHEPASVAEALRLIDGPQAKLLAGGCELVLSMRRGTARPRRIVSLRKVEGLDELHAHPKNGMRIGAKVRLRRIESDIWIAKRWAALHEAVEHLHPPQVHNMGTLVGNVCAAIPYYDLPVALAAHRARVNIADAAGKTRSLELAEFYTGPRETALRAGEMVVSLEAPPPGADAGSAFRKILKARRRSSDLHKINAAAYLALDAAGEQILDATVVVGCCGVGPQRIAAAEALLVGGAATPSRYAAAATEAASGLEAMTDLAWLEDVRRDFVAVLVRDVLDQAASRARSKHDPFDDAGKLLGEGA
jgi:carbon-monoxide dehydrogenase medium subunit